MTVVKLVMRNLLIATGFLALSACATPRERIADALVGYGIAPAKAQCVGGRLEERLSIGQLQELARLARAYRENDPNPRALTPADLIRVASQVQDARVPIEVGKAAANCGLLPGGTLGMFSALLGN
jgi:hypothetical protein